MTMIGAGTAALEVPSTYLAYAAVTPPSAAVRGAVSDALESFRTLGPGAFGVVAEQRERLRSNLARLIGTQAEHIAFVPGTTLGLNALALSLPWNKGDRVIVFTGEFPANVTPWQSAAKLFDLELRFHPLPDARDADLGAFLGSLETTLKEGVRLVAVSAVQFQTGLRMPLAEMTRLAHLYGAEIAVDAVQACGVLPVDVTSLGLDYLVCGAHKWLMGVEGAGFVYATADAVRALARRSVGWQSHMDGLRFLFEGPGELRYDRPFKAGLQFLEGSSLSTLSFAALGASVQTLLGLGMEPIFEHVSSYLDELDRGLEQRGLTTLRARDPGLRSGIASFVPPSGVQAAKIVHELKLRGVYASNPDGLVRFAPHFPNPKSEIPTVLGALDEALTALGRH